MSILYTSLQLFRIIPIMPIPSRTERSNLLGAYELSNYVPFIPELPTAGDHKGSIKGYSLGPGI